MPAPRSLFTNYRLCYRLKALTHSIILMFSSRNPVLAQEKPNRTAPNGAKPTLTAPSLLGPRNVNRIHLTGPAVREADEATIFEIQDESTDGRVPSAEPVSARRWAISSSAPPSLAYDISQFHFTRIVSAGLPQNKSK